MSVLDELREALKYATPQPPWDSVLEAVEHADDTGIDLHGANALLAKYAVNALPALLDIAEAALEHEDLIRRLAQSPPACHPLEFEVNRKRMKAALARLYNVERAA